MFRKFMLISVCIFMVLSCASRDKVHVENRRWYLVEIEGDSEIQVVNDKAPYIEFDLESQKAGGNATCNDFFTDYTIEGDSISFGQPATTKMACIDGGDQEYRFLHALVRADNWKISGDRLYLYEGGESVLIFEVR